jgi:dipeptidyl aminopeptidase/acylaminoacyl peptidase
MSESLRRWTPLLVLVAFAACAAKPPLHPGSTTAEAGRSAPCEPTVLTEREEARDAVFAEEAALVSGAFGNSDPSVSRDGRRVVFASDRGGVAELYIGDSTRVSDVPTKIASGPERAFSPRFTRDDRFVLFRRDKGADEDFHVYRSSLDGKETLDLTPTETLNGGDDVMLPRQRADVMVYTAHETSSPRTKLLVQSIEGGAPRTVYVEPTPAYGADVSPDGTHALLQRDLSASDQVAIEVDLGTGAARRIYPPLATARQGSANETARQGSANDKRTGMGALAYSSDARRIFVATDEGSEQYVVLALDAKTLVEVARYRALPSTASVAALEVSPRGDLVAVLIDAGNHTEVRLLDAHSLAPRSQVTAPLGSIQLGPFSEDGKTLTFGESTPDKPPDLYAVDAASGTIRPLRDDPRPGLAALPPLATSIPELKAFDGLAIPVNLYVPRATSPGQRFPVIAEFHGGPAWSAPIGWDPIARFLTARGYAVVQPNIRGSTGFGRAFEMADNREKRADAMRDVETVNAWIKAQPWADASRVGIFGGSYGGYLVLMALTRQPTLWRAGVDAAGPSDLRTLLRSQDQTIRSVFVDEFGDLEKDADLLERFSPMRDVARIEAPLFVYQGENDPRTPRAESDAIVREMRRRKIPVEYMVAADEGHSLAHRANLVEFLARVARFFADRMN